MKTVEVEGVQYKIMVAPPYLQHLLVLYGKLASKSVESVEEAFKVSEQQKTIMERIIEECVVEPKPEPGHYTHLYAYVNEYTNELAREVDRFFRPRRGEDGGKAGRKVPQTTK